MEHFVVIGRFDFGIVGFQLSPPTQHGHATAAPLSSTVLCDRTCDVVDRTSNLRFQLVQAVLTLVACANCLRFGEPPTAPHRRSSQDESPKFREDLTASLKAPVSRSSRASRPTVDRTTLDKSTVGPQGGAHQNCVFCVLPKERGTCFPRTRVLQCSPRAVKGISIPVHCHCETLRLNCPLRSSVQRRRHDRQPCLQLVHARCLTFVPAANSLQFGAD